MVTKKPLIASLVEHQNLWATNWIYWVGPIVGGVLAAVIYNTFLGLQKGN